MNKPLASSENDTAPLLSLSYLPYTEAEAEAVAQHQNQHQLYIYMCRPSTCTSTLLCVQAALIDTYDAASAPITPVKHCPEVAVRHDKVHGGEASAKLLDGDALAGTSKQLVGWATQGNIQGTGGGRERGERRERER